MKRVLRLRIISLAIAVCTVLVPYNTTFAKTSDNVLESEHFVTSVNQDEDNDNIRSMSSSKVYVTVPTGGTTLAFIPLDSFVFWRNFSVGAATVSQQSTVLHFYLYDPSGLLKHEWTQNSNSFTVRTIQWLPSGLWKLRIVATDSPENVYIEAGWME